MPRVIDGQILPDGYSSNYAHLHQRPPMSVWDDDDPERRIYTDLGGRKWDPLALRRGLITTSQGKLFEWYARRAKAIDRMRKAVQGEGEGNDYAELSAAELELAAAEPPLVKAARPIFEAKREPMSEAEVLRYLDDFVGWLEGKGPRSG